MKRVVSLWLPTFATDRLGRRRKPVARALRSDAQSSRPRSAPPGGVPLATIAPGPGGIRVIAVSLAARAGGVVPGLSLAGARAVLPNLAVAGANSAAERRAIEALAAWCGRYTPWTAVDGESGDVAPGGAGIWLDISGCAHLHGGEEAVLADLIERLRRCGLAAVAAVADTAGAAWAVARFSKEASSIVAPGAAPISVVAPGAAEAALAPLPVSALRLPAMVVDALHAVGLRHIGELMALPRAPLAARFGEIVPRRLDQATGAAGEPISPRLAVPAMLSRIAFAEPIARGEDIAAACRHLLGELCGRLGQAHQGARRLELRLCRTDASAASIGVGTGRPERDPRHLERLFAEKLASVDSGFGVDAMILGALVVEPLAPAQATMRFGREAPTDGVARLVDTLGNRLGADRVVRLRAQASHLPERACVEVSALSDGGAALAAGPSPARSTPAGPAPLSEQSRQPRPLHLLPWPEPIDVIAPVPDGPPAMFRWRRRPHRIAAAEGPERIGAEWWRRDEGQAPTRTPGNSEGFDAAAASRDYYRIEDACGHRFWIYREGAYRPDAPPRWFLHGRFA